MAVDQAPAPRGSFFGDVNVVMLTYLADGVLAFATGAVIARALGADGRGAYALFVLSAAFAQLVLGMGIGNAGIYYLNRREIALRDVLGAVHAVVAFAAVVSAITVSAIVPWAGEIFGDGISPWLFVAAVPLLLYLALLRLVLQALQRFVALGVTVVGQQVLVLALVTGIWVAGDVTREGVIVALIAASAAAAAFALVRVGLAEVDVMRALRPAALQRLVTFGVQGEVGNALQALNYRLDQFLVRAFVSLAGVGIYATSASLTESLFVMANAVALVLMPRLSADEDEAAWMTPIACRNTLALAAAGSVALAIAAPVVVPLVFGHAFDDSVQALWLLLPGTVALTGSKVLASYIFSRGRPLVNTAITAVSVVVTLVADVVLIPAFGVNGAAVASSLAYLVHFGAALVAYRRISGAPALDAVLARPSDARLYAEAARGLIARLAPAGRRGDPAVAGSPRGGV
ncbi:MAG TPA: polysaccharide biosynthesis C-terminal domain-containing protein [Dehalococcoidia bacterium]|nr:polysaccharide biosynthesis C-terminal domain-containing protein [Dehalococcoidia bacterium]